MHIRSTVRFNFLSFIDLSCLGKGDQFRYYQNFYERSRVIVCDVHEKFNFLKLRNLCTCHRLPRGGDWGNMGTLWGLCNEFLPLWWGKCGDLDFLMPNSRGECGDFASVQLRGDWERSVVCSFKMAEKENACFKNPLFFVYQRDHPSKICTYL